MVEKENSQNFLRDNLTIENATDAITLFEGADNRSMTNAYVKLRSYTNQVVVSSRDYVYKIYEADKSKQAFDHLVREALACVYSDLGLVWNLFSFEKDGKIYDFEQRQVLRVCSPQDDGPFENILLSISGIYEKVKEILHFDELLRELQANSEFSEVKKLGLTRASINKYNDYAMFESQAILLDDAEFCIVPLNSDSEIVKIDAGRDIQVNTELGNFLFIKLGGFCKEGDLRLSFSNKIYTVFGGWKLDLIQNQSSGIERGKGEFNSRLLTKSDAELAAGVQMTEDLEDDDIRFEKTEDTNTERHSKEVFSCLTKASEIEVYSTLSNNNYDSVELCLSTQLNPDGKILSGRSLTTWVSHMKTLRTYYPQVKKKTSIFLAQEFCQLYLNEGFNLQDFKDRFGTEIVFQPPISDDVKPSRKTFRKFLLKLTRTDSSFLSCFNAGGTVLDVIDGACENGHDAVYQAYSDSDCCMLCDLEQIAESVQ